MPRDIVQRLTRRNAELSSRLDELSRAAAQGTAVTPLVAIAVHDLRNALHLMLLEMESLTESLDDPTHLKAVETARLAGKHAAAISGSLLALARKQECHLSLVDGAKVVAELRPLIAGVAARRLDCVFDVAVDVWPVAVERQQLEAALLNLSINARDATPDGGTLRLCVRNLARGTPLPLQLAPGEYVQFTVQDTGAGMSPTVISRATEPFFTTKGANGGTGLGLYSTHDFVRRSHGALQIESQPGCGTRVSILLPRAPPCLPDT